MLLHPVVPEFTLFSITAHCMGDGGALIGALMASLYPVCVSHWPVPFPEAVGNRSLSIHRFSWRLPLDQAVSLPLSFGSLEANTHLCDVNTGFSQ